ncbi:MAG: serine/threonine-protein kinase [Polyangiaceae bacterium]
MVLEPLANLVIAGKYRLLQKLGEGGMGSVWRAEHLTLRSQVAIKLIDPSLATTNDARDRFLREAQSAASLRSPHVVQILDHGVDEGTPYIAMELLDGESLGERLARVGRLEPSEAARLLVQIGRAVGRAHDSRIVHRDLKPDNVFIVRNDDEEIAKVLDFGIAKLSTQGIDDAATGGTRTGAMLGTPYYMSPEQAEGARSLDHRSDIWAMGVIAFECLLGRRPFDGETIGGLVLSICSRPLPVPSSCGLVPASFDAWFARACCRDVNGRFTSAREASAELKRLCEDGSISVEQPTLQNPTHEPVESSAPDVAEAGRPRSTVSARSLAAVSSSQQGSDASVALMRSRRRAMAAVGIVVLLAGAAFALRRNSSHPQDPLASVASVGTVVVVPPPAAIHATPEVPLVAPARVVSVESIPTVDPVASTRPTLAKPARSTTSVAAKGSVAIPINLDAMPSEAPQPKRTVPPAPPTPAIDIPANPYQRTAPKNSKVNLGI